MAMAWSLRHIRFGWLPALTILLWVGSATSTAAGLQQVATATHVGTLLLTGVSSAIYRERLFAAVEHWPRWLAVAGMPVLMTFPLWPDGTLLRVTYMLGSPLLIVLTLLAGARHGIAFTRLLETRPMVFGGQLSYTIYLWQQLATGFHGDQKTPAFHIIAIALVLLWSVVSYLLVERPMINWGAAHSRRILSGMRPAGTPQTPPVETLAAPLLVTPHHVLDTIDPPMP
jgi:peptidoglycan/LPS O-acetylase OafA/YrhL